jgi:hypothetical protein
VSSNFLDSISSSSFLEFSCSNSSLIVATLELIAASKIAFAFAWNSSDSSSPWRSASTSSSTLISGATSSSEDSATTSSSLASGSSVIASSTFFLRSSSATTGSSATTSWSALTSTSSPEFNFVPGWTSPDLTPDFAPLLTTSLTCLRVAPGVFNLA